MTRTEEMNELRTQLFNIRLRMQLMMRDEEVYAKLREELTEVRHKIAKLKYEELLEKKEMEERNIKNGKF